MQLTPSSSSRAAPIFPNAVVLTDDGSTPSSMPTRSLLLPTITTTATSKFNSHKNSSGNSSRRPSDPTARAQYAGGLEQQGWELGDKAQSWATMQNLGDTAQNLGDMATNAWDALQNGISGAQGNSGRAIGLSSANKNGTQDRVTRHA